MAGGATASTPFPSVTVDYPEVAATVSWALTAPEAEGLPALKSLVAQLSWLARTPVSELISGRFAVDSEHVSGARELLSSLLAVPMPFPSIAQLCLYIVLVSNTYIAVFIETVARKRRQSRIAAPVKVGDSDALKGSGSRDVLDAACSIMVSWARDLVALFVATVLPQLCLGDAEPLAVSTSHTMSDVSEAPFQQLTPSAEDTASIAAATVERLTALEVYQVRPALVSLAAAVRYTTREEDGDATTFLLAIYATLCQTEVSPGLVLPCTTRTWQATSLLLRWRNRMLQEMRDSPSSKLESPLRDAVLITDAHDKSGESNDLDLALTHLRDLASTVGCSESNKNEGDDGVSFLLSVLHTVEYPSSAKSVGHPSVIEGGAGPSESMLARLALQYEHDVQACTLVETDSLDASDALLPSSDLRSSSLCRQGALLLLADVLRSRQHTGILTFGYTASTTSILLNVLDAYRAALRCSSCAALWRLLLFLHDLVVSVPKYGLLCEGETHTQLQKDSADFPHHEFSRCHTRRFEVYFAVEKELLSLSALCPSEDLRRAARMIALELLDRLAEKTRVRMYLSLITVCPYSSIARFFLEQLLQDWRARQPKETTTPPSSEVDLMLPRALGEVMDAFWGHISGGANEFVDSLVVTLNFVRVEVCRREWIRSEHVPTPRDFASSGAEAVWRSWRKLLEALCKDFLPGCHTFLESSTAQSPHPVSRRLTPLDTFSLSCAVEGLADTLGKTLHSTR